jgi:hypothetical protein
VRVADTGRVPFGRGSSGGAPQRMMPVWPNE